MRMKDYQKFAYDTCLGKCWNLEYLGLGLCGETGEVAEKLKKMRRDGDKDSKEIAKELGDVLWYLTNLANYIGYDLEDIAQINKTKLTSRIERGNLYGNGDNR